VKVLLFFISVQSLPGRQAGFQDCNFRIFLTLHEVQGDSLLTHSAGHYCFITKVMRWKYYKIKFLILRFFRHYSARLSESRKKHISQIHPMNPIHLARKMSVFFNFFQNKSFPYLKCPCIILFLFV